MAVDVLDVSVDAVVAFDADMEVNDILALNAVM